MSGNPSLEKHPGYSDLTDREKEVLQLLVEGKSHKHIAFIIICTERTVDIHKKNILEKMGLDYETDLTKLTA